MITETGIVAGEIRNILDNETGGRSPPAIVETTVGNILNFLNGTPTNPLVSH